MTMLALHTPKIENRFISINRPMIDSFIVENFRCYDRLKLTDLKRVNVIVGNNGSGKTTLLESIFLAAAGHPIIALRLRAYRGISDSVTATFDRNDYESVWKDLFYNFDQKREISIELEGNPENSRSCRIYYSKDIEKTNVSFDNKGFDTTTIIPIVFEYEDGNKQKHEFSVKMGSNGFDIAGAAQPMKIAFFASGNKVSPQETAARFSELSINNESKKFLKTFSQIYPTVEDMSVEVASQIISLYVSTSDIQQKIPLPLFSEGANRLAAYLLAIASYKNGVILIDEVENGFYYNKMADIWKALFSFAETYNVQLFVSTHSLEALRSLSTTMKGNEDAFCLLQTQTENGTHIINQIEGKYFEAALEGNVEVRG